MTSFFGDFRNSPETLVCDLIFVSQRAGATPAYFVFKVCKCIVSKEGQVKRKLNTNRNIKIKNNNFR